MNSTVVGVGCLRRGGRGVAGRGIHVAGMARLGGRAGWLFALGSTMVAATIAIAVTFTITETPYAPTDDFTANVRLL